MLEMSVQDQPIDSRVSSSRRPLLGSDGTSSQESDTEVQDNMPHKYKALENTRPDQRPEGSRHEPQVSTSHSKTPCFIYLLTILSAIGGFLFGYDTGVVSGALILLRSHFHLTSLWQELVVSVTIAAAAIFAVVGGLTNNFFGRKITILVASVVFVGGSVVLALAKSKAMLLAGRFVVGVGIGLSSMTVPIYIAESAPHHLRGRLVVLNSVFITGGQFFASVIDGAFSYDKQDGWRYMLGLAAVPAFIQFVGFLFMPESPRWLISKGHNQKALKVLQKIRGSPHVEDELEEIKESIEEAQRERQRRGSQPVILQMLTTGHVRRALLVGCMLQVFQQICGINTVMYYSASIIKMSGVKSSSAAIWLAALTASINFIFTFVGLYLVERIGRRPLTLGSLLGTSVSLAVLATGFYLAAEQAPAVTVVEAVPVDNSTQLHSCLEYSSCDTCMRDHHCGFCYMGSLSHAHNGSCLPSTDFSWGQPTGEESQYGRCATNSTVPEAEWAYGYCPTDVAWMATFGLVLYLAFFAPGMGPMPWTINSEIYPQWSRNTGVATATAMNWIFNLLVSLTFLTLTEVLTRYGAFCLYTGFSVLGLIFFFFFLPETKGRSLEQVEELFKRPLCSLRHS